MNRAIHAYPFDRDEATVGRFMEESIAGRFAIEGPIGGATLRLWRKHWRAISVEMQPEEPLEQDFDRCRRVVFLAVRTAPGDWYRAVGLLRQSRPEGGRDDA